MNLEPSPRLPRVLRGYWLAIACLTALGQIATLFFRNLLHRDQYPFGPTYLPSIYNNLDFTCFADRFRFFHQAGFFAGYHQQIFNYPAPVALVYEAFYGVFSNPTQRFVQFSAFCYVAAITLFTFALVRRGIRPLTAIAFGVSTLLLSYPAFLAFYLSNMEFAVWLVLAIGILNYVKGNGWAAAICFGVTGSFKYYPIIFLALFLARRQYKQAALGVAVFLLSLIASLWVLGPTIPVAYHGLQHGLEQFRNQYIYDIHPLESSIDHSLFALLKAGLARLILLRFLPKLLLPYLVFVSLLGIFLYLWRIRHLPILNQVLALTIASVLFPPVSHDYTLLHLYAPWGMLVLLLVDRRNDQIPSGAAAALACFAVLFTPQNWLIIHHYRLAGQLKALTLIFLLFLTLRFQFASRLDESAEMASPDRSF